MSESVAVGGAGVRAATRVRDPSLPVPTIVRRGFDVVVVVGLAVYGYVLRRDGLPSTGVWFDDSWVAAGAIHGDLTSLMMTGTGHPTFTALLMAWNQVGGGSLRSLAYPALVAGVAAPPALYLALRHLGFQRSIGLLLAAALVVADVHVQYSGRVKGYTFDTLVVIGLAVAVASLARLTWRWWTGVAWVAGAWLIGGLSGYLLVATAVAIFILVLHPAGDRRIRAVALAVQAAGQLAFFVVAQRSANLAEIEVVNEQYYDTHMDLHLNPIEFWNESIEHLRRVADIFPGGSGPWLSVVILVSLAGLVVGAWSRRPGEALPSQFFLLMVVGAFVGSLLHRFPFGPTNENLLSSGGRHALWLVPGTAFGLAVVLQRLRALVPRRALRLGFDAVLVAVAVVVLVQGNVPATAYPFAGSEEAVRFIESEIGPDDVVFVASINAFKHMVSTELPVSMIPTPDRMVGFIPSFDDPRFHTIEIPTGLGATPEEIGAAVKGADRVFVEGQAFFSQPTFNALATRLTAAGFEMTEHRFGAEVVQVWER